MISIFRGRCMLLKRGGDKSAFWQFLGKQYQYPLTYRTIIIRVDLQSIRRHGQGYKLVLF